MGRARAVFIQGGVVGFRAVALMPGKAVLGVAGVQLLDGVAVPADLGQDGGGGDGGAFPVAAH